jgi:IS5 family transposase
MEKVVPWPRLPSAIEPYYPKGKRGRPPIGLKRMLRIYFLQQLYGPSDGGLEDALYDSIAMRAFAGIDLAVEDVPDATTLLKVRRLLLEHGLTRKLFDEIRISLCERGLIMKEGTLVDATIIQAPPSTKNAEKSRDPEMHQTKKGSIASSRSRLASAALLSSQNEMIWTPSLRPVQYMPCRRWWTHVSVIQVAFVIPTSAAGCSSPCPNIWISRVGARVYLKKRVRRSSVVASGGRLVIQSFIKDEASRCVALDRVRACARYWSSSAPAILNQVRSPSGILLTGRPLPPAPYRTQIHRSLRWALSRS